MPREQVEIALADSDDRLQRPAGKPASAERRTRLADALRTNLAKRKKQARERQDAETKEQIEQPDAAKE
jgi:hypothetical protein